ncbi:MAG: alpha/beta hydrolase [Tannerella sp.]|jgi:pimeloyl-ACP methyl ester carboxylesterase|nr:alpha/beta hydrolase [Tannerella sp.]
MKKNILILGILYLNACFSFATRHQLLLSYKEEAITLKTATGDIRGTLTLPAGSEKLPVVLIIAGSGPTDRNGNSMFTQNDCLKQLAAKLAEKKIASVRYDKRGIGESKNAAVKEEDLRIEHYMDDVRSWIKLLGENSQFSEVIIIGHSEGSLIGMAASGNTGKFISIAGAGLPADEILKEQLKKQSQSILDMSIPIIDSLKKGVSVKSINPMLNSLFRPSVQPYLISWFKYNPQEVIRKVKIPVLIIQGAKDIQVSTEDANLLHKANPKSKLVIIENMNHIFKDVAGDEQENIAAYNNKSLPVNSKLVKEICSFILD